MKTRNRPTDPHPRMADMNPLLDVIFILLIFFIVTAVFIREEGLDVSPAPLSDATPPPDQSPIVLKIDNRDYVWINDKPVDIRRVAANLARLHAQAPKAALVISPSPASTTATLVSVMDQARQVGVKNINFARSG